MKTTTDPIGLYVHIPFCVKKCDYCDFCSFPISEIQNRRRYIDALCSEIRSYSEQRISIDSIFFGGGTPSLLTGDELSLIVQAIKDVFVISRDLEFTLEVNPKTLTKENLHEYLKLGVNRISIGLQSIHKNELKKLGRIHSYRDFLDTYTLVRECGVKNVSVDLMYGIPEQTKGTFSETLDSVLKLSPEHISLYGLIVEEGTPLAQNVSSYNLPLEDDECDMYYLAAEKLRDKGYLHYEISNYSKDGFSCKHNLKYWKDIEYIGVGVAAYSYYNKKRYGNSRDYTRYVADFSSCREYDETIDRNSEKYEFAMLSLRLSEGFSLLEYKERFSEDFTSGRENVLRKLCNSGLLAIDDGRIRLTEHGFYVSNAVLTELL